jgi:transcriptional regulator with XRE-family HTH domain
MYTHPQRRSSALTQKLRNEAGVWLRELRQRRGLSQRQLGARVGEHYTFISQLETGRGRIPPDRYLILAGALRIDKREFVRTLMSYYDPVTYGILFDETAESRQGGLDASGSSDESPKVRKLSIVAASATSDESPKVPVR